MKSQSGMTVVELVVIACIASVLLAIAIPKFYETALKSKMWDGMSTLMTYESAQLAHLAQRSKISPVDSIVFQPQQSDYFTYSEAGVGLYKATAKVKIGRFKPGSWLLTKIDTIEGMPRIKHTCSPGDSLVVRKYIPGYFN